MSTLMLSIGAQCILDHGRDIMAKEKLSMCKFFVASTSMLIPCFVHVFIQTSVFRVGIVSPPLKSVPFAYEMEFFSSLDICCVVLRPVEAFFIAKQGFSTIRSHNLSV